jgi:nicotinate phosphoribosyltransferase
VYKLVDIDGKPVIKESSGKITYPGRKQVFRQYEAGQMVSDRLALTLEGAIEGEKPLLQRVMRGGVRLSAPESLDHIAQRTATTVGTLPASVRRLQNPQPLPMAISHGLSHLTEHTRRHLSI